MINIAMFLPKNIECTFTSVKVFYKIMHRVIRIMEGPSFTNVVFKPIQILIIIKDLEQFRDTYLINRIVWDQGTIIRETPWYDYNNISSEHCDPATTRKETI